MDGARVSRVHPLFGVEVKDVLLCSFLPQNGDTVESCAKKLSAVSDIKALVHQQKVVIFRKQGILSADEQINISRWFGEIESAGFEQHPKSPSRLILRVSNDETEGFRDFGTSGFHVDGSFMEMPNDFSIYHLVMKPEKGTTAFVDLCAVFSGLTETEKVKWQRLWFIKTFKRIRGYSEQPGYVIHPLVYTHPVTGQKTLCLSQGKVSRFLEDWGLTTARKMSKQDTSEMEAMIDSALNADNGKYQYHHKWEAGDVVITDNLSVAHVALPDTQLPPSDVGVRVMHRTVIKGTNLPWTNSKHCLQQYISVVKAYDIDMEDVDEEDVETIRIYSFGDMDKLKKVMRGLEMSRLTMIVGNKVNNQKEHG